MSWILWLLLDIALGVTGIMIQPFLRHAVPGFFKTVIENWLDSPWRLKVLMIGIAVLIVIMVLLGPLTLFAVLLVFAVDWAIGNRPLARK